MTGEQHSLAMIKRLPVLGCLCYQRGPFISRKYPQTLRKLFCQPVGNVYWFGIEEETVGKSHYVNDDDDNRCRTPDVTFPKSFDSSHIPIW